MTTISERLSTAISEMGYEDLPAEVVSDAKDRILDFLAVSVPAWDLEDSAKTAARFARRLGGPAEATILTVGGKVPAHYAAFANGVAGHSLELDDDHNTMVGHPGVSVNPAALALAERERLDGKQLILAVVVGYEVVNRTAMAVADGTLLDKGFHPTGINGTFGATAAAGKLLGLESEQLVSALGIAGSQSSGLIQGADEGAWTKRFNPAWAAQSGILAAELAELGYVGPREVFEGKRGWYSAYADPGSVELDVVLAEWGERFEILNTSWKPYACNRYSHGPIDCAFEIRRQLGGEVRGEDVERIEVTTFREAMPATAEPYAKKVRPQTRVDAQFSSYYAVAVALITGRALLDEFSPERLADQEVLDLAGKVTIAVDEELQKLFPELYPARVVVHMKDGREVSHMVRTPKGDPEWDLTSEELEERFRTLAGRVFDERRVGEILAATREVERMDDVGDLVRLCVR